MPPASTSKKPNTTRSAPKRRAKIGASGANSPKQNTGSVVSNPAAAELKPTLCATSLSSGARLDNAGRKLSATNTSPNNSNPGRSIDAGAGGHS